MTIASPRRRIVAVIAGITLAAGTAVVVGLSVARGGDDPVRLTAEVDQRFRFDEASGVLPVLLRNRGDEQVTVTRLQLDAPSVVTGPETGEFVVRPGWTRRIRLPVKPSQCPEQGAPSRGTATAVMTVASPGDAGREIRVPAPDPNTVLDRLARTDCAVQRVLSAADIGLGEQWRRATDDGGPLLRGQLTAVRDSAGPPVTLTGIRGNVIFTLTASTEPPWRLAADDRRLAIPVEFEVSRCDLHALAEVKKRYVFSTWARLTDADGQGQQQHLEIPADPALERRLAQLIADTCQEGG